MKQWIEKIKGAKREEILILLLLGVLLLVIALPVAEESPEEIQTQTESALSSREQDTVAELEERLGRILSQVEGIGKTEVMLTLKSDGRKIVEKDTQQSAEKEEGEESGSSSRQSGSESTVFARDGSGGETPYVSESLEPEIAGVLVIAQGAGNASVAAEITEAVMALFGVEAHKIKVMKME